MNRTDSDPGPRVGPVGRMGYRILHVAATWSVALLSLDVGLLRMRLSGTHFVLAIGPSVLTLMAGEYLQQRYLRPPRSTAT